MTKLISLQKIVLMAILSFAVVGLYNVKFAKAADTTASVSVNYAVINVIEVMNQSKAVSDIKKQIGVFKDALQKQATVAQNKLAADEQALKNKAQDLSPKQLNDAKQQFQEKVQKAQQDIYAKSQNLDKVSAETLNVVQQKLEKIIEDMATSKNYSMIYQSNALAFYPKDKDITKDVIAKLNSTITKVKVKNPF